MTRAAWKIYYRLLRIARREALKAAFDAAIYGTGYVIIDEDGPHCIHPSEIEIFYVR